MAPHGFALVTGLPVVRASTGAMPASSRYGSRARSHDIRAGACSPYGCPAMTTSIATRDRGSHQPRGLITSRGGRNDIPAFRRALPPRMRTVFSSSSRGRGRRRDRLGRGVLTAPALPHRKTATSCSAPPHNAAVTIKARRSGMALPAFRTSPCCAGIPPRSSMVTRDGLRNVSP